MFQIKKLKSLEQELLTEKNVQKKDQPEESNDVLVEQIQQQNQQLKELNQEILSLKSTKQSQEQELNDLNEKLSQLQQVYHVNHEKMLKISSLGLSRDQMYQQINEYKNEIKQQQQIILHCQQSLTPLQLLKNELSAQLQQLQQEKNTLLTTQTVQLKHISTVLQNYQNINKNHLLTQLTSLKNHQIQIEKRKKEIEEKKNVYQQEKEKYEILEKKQFDRQELKIQLSLNIDYHSYKNKINMINQTIVKLVTKQNELINNIVVDQAPNDDDAGFGLNTPNDNDAGNMKKNKNKLEYVIEHSEKKLQNLRLKSAEIKGKIKSEENHANDIVSRLAHDKYDKIHIKHRNLMIKSKLLRLAYDDLDNAMKALDKSITTFHKQKMQAINNILAELWSSVYAGRDIDFIAIESEEISLNDTTTTTTKRKTLSSTKRSRRNYNYRVIMQQGDIKLPMRGRCSAGQKVLASLLIRLALAETFCLQMGVLALDEPTTNLDEANIKAFAAALSRIIEKRSIQQNFQLIIITHDEVFADLIGKRGFCDFQYRVAKDPYSLTSTIRREPIT